MIAVAQNLLVGALSTLRQRHHRISRYRLEPNRERLPVNIGILSTIGKTPLVKLERYLPSSPFELFAKLESFNPGGSSKDRPARAILESGRRSGAIGLD